MYSLTVENEKGNRLELTHNRNYTVIHIDGLTPASANINSSVTGTSDGEKFNSSRVGVRNIVIQTIINYPAEENRIALNMYFRPKHICRIYFKNNGRNVYIDGYVETIECDLFELGQTMSISILCLQPYFLDTEEIITSIERISALFEFPFSIRVEGIPFSEVHDNETATIINSGDVDIGMIIELIANGGVTNPVIYNADTREQYGIMTNMLDGDVIRINTNQGHKKIALIRSGAETNIIAQISESVDWFEIPPGENHFTYSADVGKELLTINFYTNNKYQGV